MTRILLIGYMGAGKTTLGRALAKEIGVEFIDLVPMLKQKVIIHMVTTRP